MLKYLDYAVFHGYSLNLDKIAETELELAGWLRENVPNVRACQGEAGCASEEVQNAMSGVPWTEFLQAKWNARRMLRDVSCDVDSLLFMICDLMDPKVNSADFHVDGGRRKWYHHSNPMKG